MEIHETFAKKVGEVLAFNRVGEDTLGKGRAALAPVIGEERLTDMMEKYKLHGEGLIRFATEHAIIDTVLQKSTKTEEKLKNMRELYIGDQWANPTELLEWSGFFEGAAIVHWAFVLGGAQSLGDEALIVLAEEGKNYRYELLEMAESELEAKGQNTITE